MKRSKLDQLILENRAFMERLGFHLPPFAYWSAEQWRSLGPAHREIIDCQLGWDVTDFGSGDFHKTGLFLVTLRNGCAAAGYPKTYAEKIMVVEEKQVTPMHFHWYKMEDIINRGGGNLMVQVYNSTPSEELDQETPVTVYRDGGRTTVEAGAVLCLEPGQSITMQTGLYHSFWGQEGRGKVLVGEVSMCNDDTNDNRFLRPTGRFQAVEEDAPAQFLLVNELTE